MYVIYKHTNKINNKCYVGQTSKSMEERWNEHVYFSKRGSELCFHRAIKKYEEDNFTHKILETLDTESVTLALEREIYWIAQLNCVSPNGYNLTYGGEGSGIPSEETRRKNSESNKIAQNRPEVKERNRQAQLGKKHTVETKQKLSEAKIGTKHSEESKLKMSERAKITQNMPEVLERNRESHLGKKHAEETKTKISESLIGEKNPFYGKKHDEETKLRMRENHADFFGENNPMYGKKRRPESILKQRETRRKNKEIKELGKILLSFYEPNDLWNN